MKSNKVFRVNKPLQLPLFLWWPKDDNIFFCSSCYYCIPLTTQCNNFGNIAKRKKIFFYFSLLCVVYTYFLRLYHLISIMLLSTHSRWAIMLRKKNHFYPRKRLRRVAERVYAFVYNLRKWFYFYLLPMTPTGIRTWWWWRRKKIARKEKFRNPSRVRKKNILRGWWTLSKIKLSTRWKWVCIQPA